MSVIDIIIPIYKGYNETKICLQSVLKHPQIHAFEIIVINDCSPEPKIVAYLKKLQKKNQITLLHNSENQGFSNTVNRGIVQHPDRDVVLLNSDTEVNGAWLDRLHYCAYQQSHVGSVTPFSNNATICSYPLFLHDNLLPKTTTLAAIDSYCQTANKDQSIEIPTAIGFCMYITRSCIETIGYFNAHEFPRGYGEENDFCMRAINVGFKHLLCGYCYVYHTGSVSFGKAGKQQSLDAQQTLARLHPHYADIIAKFIERDPGRALRRNIDLHRLTQSSKKKLLFITHRLSGGTEKHIHDLIQLLRDYDVLILRPTSNESISVEWGAITEEFKLFYQMPHSYDDLCQFLKQIQIIRIHFHHTLEINELIYRLSEDIGVAYDFTLHDYHMICPQYNLSDERGNYCGEPDNQGCNQCLKKRPASFGMDITTWRSQKAHFLKAADRVIAPSQDVVTRMQKYMPEINFICMTHPETIPEIPIKPLKILLLGGLSFIKGLNVLKACVMITKEQKLPLFFYLIGNVAETFGEYPELPYSCSGPYDDDKLLSMIIATQADVIFFPALWPETFSYTLSTAMTTGLPIAAPTIGAFTERLENHPKATLKPWDTEAKQWIDYFLEQYQCKSESNQ